MKNFINKIFGRHGKQVTVDAKNYSGASGYMGLNPVRAYDNYKSYAYACINTRAENVSKAKIILYRLTDSGKFNKEVTRHPFLDLIRVSNRRGHAFKELLHKVSSSLDLYGNAYLYIHRANNGRPAGFYHLPSKSVRIKLNPEMSQIDRYIYFNGRTNIEYEKKDILHFLIPDPDNSFLGKSIISGFNFTQEIDYLQNLYQKNFYKNDAAVGMLLESEKSLSDNVFERLRNEFRDQYEGSENAGKTIILEGGIKAKPYQAFPKDVEILPSRKMIRDEILAMFRVPKIILGVAEEVNRATARESMKIFNDYVIKPFAKICIESKLNIFLKENFKGEDLQIVMEYEFEVDRDMQLKALEIYSKYGIATRDEMREIEGFSTE
ncbi:MAG: phage portal protein [Bacteroidetes bacterium]|nr:phage portal protein [Bacteroidota bacterium]